MASIEKRTDRATGRVVSYRVVWRQDGQKQSATLATAADAAQYRKLVEGSGNRWPLGHDPRLTASTTAPTFGEWARQAVNQRTRASAGTKLTYRRDIERHLDPLLGHLPLDRIGDAEVAAWVADATTPKKGRKPEVLSAKTVRNLHGLASSVFADAMAQHPPLVTRNPFARRLPAGPAVKVEEMVFLTGPEIATLVGEMRDEPATYRALARLLFATGLRFGEATALTVADVDLAERRTLRVTKAWKRVDTAQYVIGEPKTPRSRRTIGLSDRLVELLTPHVDGRRGGDLLFTDRHGQRLPHIEFYKRAWAPAVARMNACVQHREADVDGRGRPKLLPDPCGCAGTVGKRPRIHDARHTHVALLIADGVPLPAISRRLGHSSISITIDRYGHLDPSLDATINDAVDRALSHM